MKRAGFAALLSAASLTIANAAVTAPPVPVWSWTGFYIGGDVGGGWNSGGLRADYLPFPAFGNNPTIASSRANGIVAGAFAGYNWSFAPQWVIGFEGDVSRTHLNSSTTVIGTYFGGAPSIYQPTSFTRNLSWLETVRARIGYTITPNWLLYITGGAAWGSFDDRGSYFSSSSGPNNLWINPFNTTSSGYVAGGGAEWMMSKNFLLRVEYLYYHLAGQSNLASNPAFSVNPILFTFNATNNGVGRVGISYKF